MGTKFVFVNHVNIEVSKLMPPKIRLLMGQFRIDAAKNPLANGALCYQGLICHPSVTMNSAKFLSIRILGICAVVYAFESGLTTNTKLQDIITYVFSHLGPYKRGERDQVGSPGQVSGQLQRRHVPQNMDHGQGNHRIF